MTMGIDHARHDDAAPGIDLEGRLRSRQARSDVGNGVADDENIRVPEDRVAVVQREDDAVPEDDGLTISWQEC
jgi:hypothetical protein